MARRLILHVGDCKTGSTLLQTMLARGDCVPETLRLFSPGPGVHSPLARSLGDRPQVYPARWDGIAQRLEKTDWDVAVLSSELFEFINPRKVARAVETHLAPLRAEITVLAYVRPHAGRVLSQFAENLKLGHDTGTFSDFITRFLKLGRLNYSGRLAAWKEAFGEAFVMRPFDRDHLLDGDLRRDFLSLVLAGAPYKLIDSGQDDNASLTLPDLALMRHLQRRFDGMPMDNRVAFGKQFGRLLREQPQAGAEKLRLPRAVYNAFAETALADAATLDAQWLSTPVFVPALQAISNEVLEKPQDLNATSHHDVNTLRVAEAFADLLMRQMNDDPKDFSKRMRAPLASSG